MKQSKKEKKALELGKIWMKNSLSAGHDYEHAQNVEEHSLKVLASLREQGIVKGREVDESLVQLAAWWHDAYKARLKQPSISGAIFEGFRSERIIDEQLKGLLSKKRLKALKKAVRYHNHPYYYFIMRGRHPILSQILIEADGLEDLRDSRMEKQMKSVENPVLRFGIRVMNRVMISVMKVFARSEYTKRILKSGVVESNK